MGYDMHTVDKNTYYRLNIWGMGRCREYMYQLGMAVDSDFPKWPDPKDFGFASNAELWEVQEKAEWEEGRIADDRVARWEEAMAKARREHGSDDPGFPLHKVGSNDGCVVTPKELTDALAIYDSLQADPDGRQQIEKVVDSADQEWWDEWIAYLRQATTEGGVAVY